ncbi:hypothetical protein CAOG_006858 [Capsaspora owczarzaki ATCC 30864]|uniref:Uncharacterized protein n=2 Tax=Capsaspora owczarzaki (strain ATCC 30864) TaxID=595528 RepID=A0A0D2VY04_CAPO3|nr:hypothetical protein CAOG_006858 [Capsaspora owczarzaki ATCC 30864]
MRDNKWLSSSNSPHATRIWNALSDALGLTTGRMLPKLLDHSQLQCILQVLAEHLQAATTALSQFGKDTITTKQEKSLRYWLENAQKDHVEASQQCGTGVKLLQPATNDLGNALSIHLVQLSGQQTQACVYSLWGPETVVGSTSSQSSSGRATPRPQAPSSSNHMTSTASSSATDTISPSSSVQVSEPATRSSNQMTLTASSSATDTISQAVSPLSLSLQFCNARQQRPRAMFLQKEPPVNSDSGWYLMRSPKSREDASLVLTVLRSIHPHSTPFQSASVSSAVSASGSAEDHGSKLSDQYRKIVSEIYEGKKLELVSDTDPAALASLALHIDNIPFNTRRNEEFTLLLFTYFDVCDRCTLLYWKSKISQLLGIEQLQIVAVGWNRFHSRNTLWAEGDDQGTAPQWKQLIDE